jgi:CutC family
VGRVPARVRAAGGSWLGADFRPKIRRTGPHAPGISVESVDGVQVPARAGAARAELCAGLSDGALTPSAALIEAAAELAEVHVLVRP